MLAGAGDMRHGPAGSTSAAPEKCTASSNRRRRLKSMLEWGVSHMACCDREHQDLAATVCPWQTPPEGANLLKVLMLGTM